MSTETRDPKRRTANSELWRDEQGIIHQRIFEGSFDIEEAKETVEIIDEFAQTDQVLLCVDLRPGRSQISRDARVHFAQVGFKQKNSHLAFVVNSRIGETFANLFLKIHQPPYDARVFHEYDQAIVWLLDNQDA